MIVDTHKEFDKAWAKLGTGQKRRAKRAIKLYGITPDARSLRVHQLTGKLYPQYSMSVGGDLRIHFLKDGENRIVLTIVGTHAQLYK